MNSDDLFEPTFNDETGEFEDSWIEEDDNLFFNPITGEFESYDEKEISSEEILRAIYDSHSALETLGAIMRRQSEAFRIIQECEKSGINLTEEQKSKLFDIIFNIIINI